jgi:hypothetical protein
MMYQRRLALTLQLLKGRFVSLGWVMFGFKKTVTIDEFGLGVLHFAKQFISADASRSLGAHFDGYDASLGWLPVFQSNGVHSIYLKPSAAYANNLHSDRPVASLERYAWQIVFTYLLSRPGWGAIGTEWCEERHDMLRASRSKSFSSGSMERKQQRRISRRPG